MEVYQLQEILLESVPEWSGLEVGQVAGFCVSGNEPSGSYNKDNFLTSQGNIAFLRITLFLGVSYFCSYFASYFVD
jgi:hypothetical protein